jgi:hypothetical protein
MKSLNVLVVESHEDLLATLGDLLRRAFSGTARKNPTDPTNLAAGVNHLAHLMFSAYVAARETVIIRQSATILEISTPALLIWDKTSMMPLVGIIDISRARHVMQQLLHGSLRRWHKWLCLPSPRQACWVPR